MHASRWVVGALVVLGCAATAVRADTLHLTNGRKLQGEIDEEKPNEIVLKTTDGTVRVPRALIQSIERETATVNKLEAARALAKVGDRRAETRFEEAIAGADRAGDEETASRARRELDAYRVRSKERDLETALADLARARELAAELSPAAPLKFEHAIAFARRAGEAAIVSDVTSELDAFRTRFRGRSKELATTHLAEARALAREVAPAAVPRYEQAIAEAEAAEEAALAKAARSELAALRQKLAAAGDSPAPASDDPDELTALEEKLRQGDRTAGARLVEKLLARGRARHEKKDCVAAVADFVRGRAALVLLVPYGMLAPRLTYEESELATREDRCRREACGRAVRSGDGATAVAILDPLAHPRDGTPSRDPHVLYLDGRAHEANGELEKARVAFESAVGSVPDLQEDPSLDLLRYLARLAAEGRPIATTTPGVGSRWMRSEGKHVCFFSERDDASPEATKKVDAARASALERLGLTEPFGIYSVKTPVFVFKSADRYRQLASRSWTIGHAALTRLEDGAGSAIVTFASGEGASELPGILAHEFAHVLVDEATQGADLPSWVIEGVAVFAGGDDERSRLRATLAGPPAFLEDFVRQRIDPRYVQEDPVAATQFYAEAAVVFEACVRRASSVKVVLDAAQKLDRDRLDGFLKAVKFDDVFDLDREIRKVLGVK